MASSISVVVTWQRVSVCGGAFRAAGVPDACMKGLSGGIGGGKCRMADTAR